MSDMEMNWVDETQCSERVDAFAERSLSIDASLFSKKDLDMIHLSVCVDGVDDFQTAVDMVQAAINAAPDEYTGELDDALNAFEASNPMPGEMMG